MAPDRRLRLPQCQGARIGDRGRRPRSPLEGGEEGRLSPRSAQVHHVQHVRHGSCATETAFWVDRAPHPRIEGTRAEPYFEIEGEHFFDGWP